MNGKSRVIPKGAPPAGRPVKAVLSDIDAILAEHDLLDASDGGAEPCRHGNYDLAVKCRQCGEVRT